MSRRNVPFTFFWMVGFVFKFFGKLRSRTICRKPQKVILILDRYPIKDVKNSQKLSFFENIANCSKKWENPNPSILRIVLSYYYYPYHFLSAYWFLTLEISLSVPKISPSRCHINETSFHSFKVESLFRIGLFSDDFDRNTVYFQTRKTELYEEPSRQFIPRFWPKNLIDVNRTEFNFTVIGWTGKMRLI